MKVSSERSFQPITWQVLTTKPKQPTHINIQQNTTTDKESFIYAMIHNEYAQENRRINRQDRWKVTIPVSAYPKEISQQCTPAIHTEAVHCQRVLMGSSIPVSDH